MVEDENEHKDEDENEDDWDSWKRQVTLVSLRGGSPMFDGGSRGIQNFKTAGPTRSRLHRGRLGGHNIRHARYPRENSCC
jgi:hypothetical protein